MAPRLFLALVATATLAALAAPAPANATAPMVLLLHGGGWQTGVPSSMYPYRDDFAARGYRTRVVAYPLRNVTYSIDYVDAIAQEERLAGEPVIAYGISAGGTIAAALAAQGRVDGAVDVIGATNFTTWFAPAGQVIMLLANMSAAEKVSASPYWRLNGLQTPQLLQCGQLDPVTTYDQCTSYTDRARQGNPDTTLQAMLNAHAHWPADRDRARAWVQARWPASNTTARAKLRRTPARRAACPTTRSLSACARTSRGPRVRAPSRATSTRAATRARGSRRSAPGPATTPPPSLRAAAP